MWHALPHLPPERSRAESSGTGLIAAALLRAVAGGLLPVDPFQAAAGRAIEALLPRIGPDGLIANACPGPGPLIEEAPWRDRDFPPGDPHGPGCILEAQHGASAIG